MCPSGATAPAKIERSCAIGLNDTFPCEVGYFCTDGVAATTAAVAAASSSDDLVLSLEAVVSDERPKTFISAAKSKYASTCEQGCSYVRHMVGPEGTRPLFSSIPGAADEPPRFNDPKSFMPVLDDWVSSGNTRNDLKWDRALYRLSVRQLRFEQGAMVSDEVRRAPREGRRRSRGDRDQLVPEIQSGSSLGSARPEIGTSLGSRRAQPPFGLLVWTQVRPGCVSFGQWRYFTVQTSSAADGAITVVASAGVGMLLLRRDAAPTLTDYGAMAERDGQRPLRATLTPCAPDVPTVRGRSRARRSHLRVPFHLEFHDGSRDGSHDGFGVVMMGLGLAPRVPSARSLPSVLFRPFRLSAL